MDFDMQQAEVCLHSLDLITLFQGVLRWNAPIKGHTVSARVFNHTYRARCIAQRDDVRIWEVKLVKLNTAAQLSSNIKVRLYQSIHKKYPQPLIIFIDYQQKRSLWYWRSCPHRAQSLVFIAQQPLMGWRPRLKYLATYTAASGNLDLQPRAIHCKDLVQQLRQQLNYLIENIEGIDDIKDRRWYAAILLQRLIIVQGLQQKGFLNNDIWYLHNQLGRSQQQQQNVFFRQVLQPLFTQGLALPSLERPRSLSWSGQIPYLGDVFYTHPLEKRYTSIDIPDFPFESLLLWFEYPLWQKVNDFWQASSLGLAFEQVLAYEESESVSEIYQDQENCCEQILNRFILRQLGINVEDGAPDFWDFLFYGNTEHLRQLVQTVLPQFSILDPACGVGTLLVELQHRLVDIYSVLIGQIQYFPDSQLDIWLKGLKAEHPSLLHTIYGRIFKYGLYGVDINPVMVDSTRLQLLMGMVAIAQKSQDIEPLPNLNFNIVTGNSLIGFIRVNETGFDRLQAIETLLQGNLLQPLVAENYRTILSEKKIALEYYRSHVGLLEELQQDIPRYAQLEFFRDQIDNLDVQAQAKLNELLLSDFSQTLGIRFKETQLVGASRPRLVCIEDLTALNPFHWGYHFSHVLEQSNGFNVILSSPPRRVLRPTVQEFFQEFRDLTSSKNLDVSTFKSAKQALINVEPDVANAWLFYQSQYSLVTDYFYRSPQYAHQSPLLRGKRQRTQLRLHWLFIERCFNLLSPQGVCGLVVSNDIKESPRGIMLRSLLETQANSALQVNASDVKPIMSEMPDRYFLWFCKKLGR
ncbi:MAG: hypothetical protein F6K11_14870 [Leptolyngbya sp. SIO3F4]|nr:hypothetical protein [Leptolyngbya sp. SIO3F4]